MSVASIMVLGAVSDRLDRRTIILIPAIGHVVRSICLSLVIAGHVGTQWLVIGAWVEGLSGGNCGLFFGAFLYTSDVTPPDRKRTVGMSVLEGVRGLVGATCNVLAGHAIQEGGYRVTAGMSLGFALLCIISILILPNSKRHKTNTCTNSCTHGVWTFSLPKMSTDQQGQKIVLTPSQMATTEHVSPDSVSSFSKRNPQTQLASSKMAADTRGVQSMVTLASVAFFLSFVTTFGVQRVRLLYLMQPPFCLGAVSLGWYCLAREMIYNMASICATPLLYGRLPGVSVGVLGAAANVMEYLSYAAATQRGHLGASLVMSFGQSLPVSLIRGETSRLLAPRLQVALFSRFAMLESISFVCGTMALPVYTAVLDVCPGAVFIGFAGIKVVVIITMIYYQSIWREHQILR